jgi:hypothetical protein
VVVVVVVVLVLVVVAAGALEFLAKMIQHAAPKYLP